MARGRSCGADGGAEPSSRLTGSKPRSSASIRERRPTRSSARCSPTISDTSTARRRAAESACARACSSPSPKDAGASVEDALDAAVAVEVLHNYSLIHDDIEDGDRLRHGRETLWAKYGIAQAINAGDALCALSFLALLRAAERHPAERMT